MGGEAGGAPLSLMADVPSGLITVRWCASGDRLAAPLARLGELAAKHGGRGALVYLPPGARRTRRSTLVREANEEIRRKLLKVFDPAGVFCSDRL